MSAPSEEQEAKIKTLEAEVDRLTAALEVERAWWENVKPLVWQAVTEERLEALTAALEGKKADTWLCVCSHPYDYHVHGKGSQKCNACDCLFFQKGEAMRP